MPSKLLPSTCGPHESGKAACLAAPGQHHLQIQLPILMVKQLRLPHARTTIAVSMCRHCKDQ